MSTKRIVDNVLSLGVLQVANYVLPFVTTLHLVGALGAERFGLISFSAAFTSYFIIFTEFGFNFSAVQSISLVRDEPDKLASTYASVMLSKALLVAVSLAIVIGVTTTVDIFAREPALQLITFGIVVGQAMSPLWLFQGLERMRYVALLGLLGRVAATIGTIMFTREPADYLVAPAANSIAAIMSGAIGIWIADRHYGLKVRWQPWSSVVEQLGRALPFFASNVASSVYTVSTAVSIGVFAGDRSVGIYAAADKLVQAAKGAFYPVSRAIFPVSSRRFSQSFEAGLAFVAKVGVPTCGGMLVVSLVMWLLGESLILWLYGAQYQESVRPLRALAFVPAIVCASEFLGVQILVGSGRAKAFRNVLSICALATLPLAIGATKAMGVYGAALAVLVTEGLITCCLLALVVTSVWRHRGTPRSEMS